MSQPIYNYINLGTVTTSTGAVLIRTGPGILHTVTIHGTSTTGSPIIFYDSTSSSTGLVIASVTLTGTVETLSYDIALDNGLLRGHTTSTADITVTWA